MDNTVAQLWHRGQIIDGEVGIEVEVEGEKLPDNIPKSSALHPRYWTTTRDGSLRGEAFEYVLTAPVSREHVKPALSQLYSRLDKCVVHDSGRAGIHVHINVRELTLTQMFTFVLLYMVFEKVLVRFCGEEREGNLFCLRVTDAEYLAMLLQKSISRQQFNLLSTDDLRYASINLTALRKYGSLEFRAMRSPVSQEILQQWVTTLLAIKDSAARLQDPEELILGISQDGGEDFARMHLGPTMDFLGVCDWRKEVLDGLRVIQPIVKTLSAASKTVKVKILEPEIAMEDIPWDRGLPEGFNRHVIRGDAVQARVVPNLGLPHVAMVTFQWIHRARG